ncbi:hypothetical protein MK280_10600 [Myxococcota bacterium]|nr:hypothetical protein [Myxococcota bacterium]
MRWLNCTLMMVVALGLVSCDAESEGAAEGVSWLMVQNAEGLSFAFDDAVDAACPGEAFWSGAMTMTGVDEETLYFTDRPSRRTLTQPTSDFVANFDEAFAPDSGGYPNAVLSWEDAATSRQRADVVELSSPTFDASTSTLVYSVCGLRLDDHETLMPFPDDQQVRPEAMPDATGRVSLFVDGWLSFTAGFDTGSCVNGTEGNSCRSMEKDAM